MKAFATLRDAFQGGSMTIELSEDSRIKDLLKELEKNLGEGFRKSVLKDQENLNPNIKVLVNGREISYLDGVETKLKDGDIVAFIPPVGGG